MPGPRDLLNPPAARQLGLTVDPLQSTFETAQAPDDTLTDAPAIVQATSSQVARPPASAIAPQPAAGPPAEMMGAPGSRERKVAFARQTLSKFGLQDDDGVWSNHLADLFDAQIQANQMKQHKAETLGAISSFLPAVTRMYAMQRGLQAHNDMMKEYEAEAKAKGIDLADDGHYLTMKRNAAMAQQKLIQQLKAVDQMYGDLTDKHGIDFGNEATVTPLAIKMLLTNIKSGKTKLPGAKGSSVSPQAGAAPMAGESGGTPVDTDGDGLPDVLMPDEYLASVR